MSLRVLDAASHQGNMAQENIDFDALIVKATEGCTYVNPYCDREFQKAFRQGKKLGVYHLREMQMETSRKQRQRFLSKIQKGTLAKPSLCWTGRTKIPQM